MKFIGCTSKTVKKRTRKNTLFFYGNDVQTTRIAPVTFTCVERLDGWTSTPFMKVPETSGSFMEVLGSFHPILTGWKLPSPRLELNGRPRENQHTRLQSTSWKSSRLDSAQNPLEQNQFTIPSDELDLQQRELVRVDVDGFTKQHSAAATSLLQPKKSLLPPLIQRTF